jgi:hypothetical protein
MKGPAATKAIISLVTKIGSKKATLPTNICKIFLLKTGYLFEMNFSVIIRRIAT